MYDAEGIERGEVCPECGSNHTVTYVYLEGFTELECYRCGYSSESQDISELARYRGDLSERERDNLPPIPIKKLEA